MTASSSHINFIKAHNSMVSNSKNETQAFKAKRSHVSNNRGMSHKTQPPLTQRGKAQTRAPQPRHAYMYTITIIIGMLNNTMHINMLHKPIKIHIVIVNVCLTL